MKIILIVLLLLLMPVPSLAQDSILYCIEVGRLAKDIAHAMQGGLTADQINFAFPNARPDEMDQAEAWGAKLKIDVIEAMKTAPDPDAAAQRVMQECAYQYGKNYKRTDFRGENDVDTDARRQFCWSYISRMKSLYRSIKMWGSVKFMEMNPPERDGVPRARAEKIAGEIEADRDPQSWIEAKWKGCLSEQGL